MKYRYLRRNPSARPERTPRWQSSGKLITLGSGAEEVDSLKFIFLSAQLDSACLPVIFIPFVKELLVSSVMYVSSTN